MIKAAFRATAATVAISLAAPLAAQESDATATATTTTEADARTVVASVNGTEITLGQMILIRAGLPQQYRQLPDEVLFKGILDQLVQQAVLADTQEGQLPMRVQMALENEQRNMLAAEAVEAMLEGVDSDEAVQKAYEERYADAEPVKEFNASHILVETEEEAQKLVDELSGDADFAELAKQHSTGPSGPNGGELGWFGPGMMVKEFEDAVAGMEDGAVAGPIKTQFGWHVIKLNESRMQEAPPLDEVREEIVTELQKDYVEKKIEELTAAAEIDRSGAESLDPNLLSNVDLLSE